MIKWLARQIIPRQIWRRMRGWRTQRSMDRFHPYQVEHEYAGVQLKVAINDPLARAWYDQPWGPMREVDLLRAAGLTPSATVFDVGAHQGVVAMILAHHVGPSGKVVAVEALEHNSRACQANRELNGLRQIHVEAAAIADRSGELEVTVDLNSHVRNQASTNATAWVRAVTIDDLADEHGPPDVLFIDVEGYECHALRGARRVMAHAPDCYIEIHQGCGLELAGGTLADVFSFFPADRYDFRAWGDDDPTLREVEGPSDCPATGRVILVAVRREI